MSININDESYVYSIPSWVGDLPKGSTYDEILQALLIKLYGVDGTSEEYQEGSFCYKIKELEDALNQIKEDFKFDKDADGTEITQLHKDNWTGFEAYDFYLRSAQRNVDTAVKLLQAAEDFFTGVENLKDQLAKGAISQSQFAMQFQSLLMKLETVMKNAEKSVNELIKTQTVNEDNLFDWDYSKDYDPDALYDGMTHDQLHSEVFFEELNLLNKIKYISIYYNPYDKANLPVPFPADYTTVIYYKGERLEVSRGFPALPQNDGDEISGAMEAFYVSFLITRDSPINAFSTFLETKVQALRKQVEALTKDIAFFNALMGGLNTALQELNSGNYKPSQGGDGDDKNYDGIPEAAYNAVVYFLTHPTRKVTIKDEDGTEQTYFLIQPADKDVWDDEDNDGKSGVSTSGNYLLVKADSGSVADFLNMKASDIENLFGNPNEATKHGLVALTIPDDKLTESDSETGQTSIKSPAKVDDYTITFMEAPSAYGYPPQKYFRLIDSDEWSKGGKDTKVTADVVNNSWAQGIQGRIQSIETETQKVNNDVMAMRSKIDTFDTTASTLRKRASDTYLHAIGNIR